MLHLYRPGRHAVAWFLPKRYCSSEIPMSAETLIGNKKTKVVPPSQPNMSELENQHGFEHISSDLISNANILAAAEPKRSKIIPITEPSSACIGVVHPPTLIPSVEPKVQIHSADKDTTAVLDVARQQEELLKLALPFDEVPGPAVLKFLAKMYSYVPKVGTQVTAGAMMYFLNMLGTNLIWNRSARPFIHMFDKYGPVVRLQGIFGGNIVFVSRPEHIETVFQQEGRYPVRSSLDSIETYRLKYRKIRTLGPYIMSGPDWETLRSKLEVPFQKSLSYYHNKMEDVANELITRIHSLRNRQEEMPATFNIEIYKWALENVSMIALGKHLGLLDPSGLGITSESVRLLEAVQNASHALRGCESGFQIWRFFETREWRKLVASCDIIDSIATRYIRIAETCIQSKKSDGQENASLLEMLLLTENIHPDDILTIVLDMFLIGVNTTSHALSYLLYYLSKNPRVQRGVYDELVRVMPRKDSPLSYSSLQHLRYLQACLKESLRLQPPIPVITRVLPHDIALHSYKIPKGTYMLMTSHVTSLREENFEDAHKFKPERWLMSGEDIHPFAAIPFGHGPRVCVGRGLAEMQLMFAIAKVIRNFSIEYHYGQIHASSKFIDMPRKPLKFRFVDRSK